MGFCGHFILAQGYTSRALKAETLWCDELMWALREASCQG